MLVNSAIWLITITLILVSSIKSLASWIREIRAGEKDYVGFLIMEIVVIVLCGFAFYKHISDISKYEKHPRVVTTEAPKIDTLRTDGKTYYFYEFQDNLRNEIKIK